LDWKVFEAVGKYAGLAGIALTVLLYIFRQILKLKIFKNVGSAGTLLLINNIIDKVFWVTIVALLAWLALGLFGKTQAPVAGPENVSTIYGENIKVSDLPSDFLSPVQEDSVDDVSRQLKQRNSLSLNGTTVTIGIPGEGRTVTIGCNTLRMSNGAKIITNGNYLVLECVNLHFGENAGIVSYAGNWFRGVDDAESVPPRPGSRTELHQILHQIVRHSDSKYSCALLSTPLKTHMLRPSRTAC
jgi:hypothetical protein